MLRRAPVKLVTAACLVLGLTQLGFDCRMTNQGGDGGPGGDDASTPAPPTCSEYCACMTSTCRAVPFAPDCATQCASAGGTWDLTCRTNACNAAAASPAKCDEAGGQGGCQ